MYLSQVLFIFSAAFIGTSHGCAPVQQLVHESLRCEVHKDKYSSVYQYDDKCCAGSDLSNYRGRCSNGFTKIGTTRSCGYDDSSCNGNSCKEFTCVKSPSCVQYAGCFTFNSVSSYAFNGLKKATGFRSWKTYAGEFRVSGIVSECANYCRKYNYAYAIVQGAETCYCGGATLPSHSVSSGTSCGENSRKTLGLSCGDGRSTTCTQTSAVYLLTGTEYCCSYEKTDDTSLRHASIAVAAYLTVYLVFGVGCGLFWTVGPCIIGLCIFLHYRKKRQASVHVVRAQVGRVTVSPVTVNPAVVTAQTQPIMVTAQPSTIAVKGQPQPVVVQAQSTSAVVTGQPQPAVVRAQSTPVVATGTPQPASPVVVTAQPAPADVYPTVAPVAAAAYPATQASGVVVTTSNPTL